MKSKIFIGSVALLSIGALAWAAKDPVVMTVNGVPVTKSEFEYLYHKNSQQQTEAQPIDEYVGLFELYKMKVEDAKACGIDKSPAFIEEMQVYRRELASPYLVDSVYLNKLVDEAYNRSAQEVEINHIMLPKGNNAAENSRSLALADSIRQLLIGGADFDELALKYSTDQSVKNNKGHLGYVSANMFPYHFETAAYTLKPGEISDIVESFAGYHILVGGNKRPSKGMANVSHILMLVRPGTSPEQEAKIKERIDSIYNVVAADPSKFAQMAQTFSNDPGSAVKGGQLNWFSAGQMIPEFSEVAFDLPKGAISQPIRTSYGWHIIMKNDEKPGPGKEEIKPMMLQRFNDKREDRYKMIRDDRIKRLAKKHKGKEMKEPYEKMRGYVAQNGIDSVFYTTFGNSKDVLYVVEGKSTPVSEFVASFKGGISTDPYGAGKSLEERYLESYDNALIAAEEDWLEAKNADYRNLLNEYREGSLLYEVSKLKVWDKASEDVEGLENYFQQHRDNYKFDVPKAKGILVQAINDSIGNVVKARYAEIQGTENVLETLKKEFRNQAVFDKVFASQGVNMMVDNLMFGGPVPKANEKYPLYFMLDPKIITQPETASDIKGPVTTDYQNELEQEWVIYLRNTYPVVRYDEELKKVK